MNSVPSCEQSVRVQHQRFVRARLISFFVDAFDLIAVYIRCGVRELIGGATGHCRDGSPAAVQVSGLPRRCISCPVCDPPPHRHAFVPLSASERHFIRLVILSALRAQPLLRECRRARSKLSTRISSTRPDSVSSRTVDPAASAR